jgi:flagellar hook protein FlgE
MSFQQALSGLNASGKNLQVIGNNIANASTIGTKAARAEFTDMFARALNGTGATNVGIGVNLVSVAQQFTQGNMKTTENPLDVAINGSGFFQLTDGLNPTTYSRNGQFKLDREGFIVNNSRDRLMGYPADAEGVIQPGQAVALQLPTGSVAPRATTEIELEANMDSRVATRGSIALPSIDYGDAETYNNATSLTVYDDKGQQVALTYYFQKADTDTWHVFATANGEDVMNPGGAPAPVTTITFAANGSAPTAPQGPVAFTVPAGTNAAGAVTLPIAMEMDIDKLTQYGSPFGVTDLRQDGFSAGQLSGIAVESDGVVMARYSNGQSRPAGQIELVNFRNPQGLQPIGENAWLNTPNSGDPLGGVPGVGSLGSLQAGSLEESNVDLTGELVNMIVAQRIYQANAQTVKTMDQVLQTLVNMR